MTPAKIIQILPTNLEMSYTNTGIDHLLEGIDEIIKHPHLLERIEREAAEGIPEEMGEVTEETLEEMGEVAEESLEEMEETTEEILEIPVKTSYINAEAEIWRRLEKEATEEILEEMGEVTEEVLEEMEEEEEEEDTEEILEIPVEVPYTSAEAEIDQMLKELEEEATAEEANKLEATAPENPEAVRVRDLWNTLRNPWNPIAQRNLETEVQADVLACQELMEQATHLATRLGMLELLLLGGGDRVLHQPMIDYLAIAYPAVAEAIKGQGRPNQIWEEISANNIQ